MRSPITGTAAGVPFTALPPAGDDPAPLLVTWHMLDAPRSDAAFAAALPLHDLPAWRVHLGMPMCGARMVDGRMDAGLELMRKDVLMSFLHPFVQQAAEEFPAALAAIRTQLPVDGGPIGVLGGSLGGAVALRILADTGIPVAAAAVVNAAIRMRSVVDLFPGDYPYDAESEKAVDSLDFLPRASTLARRAPLLVVSGELDHPALRADAVELVEAVGDRAALLSIPGLAHPLADEPGIEPAPQLPAARAVDAGLTAWFRRHLTGRAERTVSAEASPTNGPAHQHRRSVSEPTRRGARESRAATAEQPALPHTTAVSRAPGWSSSRSASSSGRLALPEAGARRPRSARSGHPVLVLPERPQSSTKRCSGAPPAVVPIASPYGGFRAAVVSAVPAGGRRDRR